MEWQPIPVFLPGKFHGQRSLAGYSPWGRKESNLTEWLTLLTTGGPVAKTPHFHCRGYMLYLWLGNKDPICLMVQPKKIIKFGILGFPGGSDGKESACNVGDLGSIPQSGRYPGEGNGYPLQYSCLESPMDRGAWWATVYGVSKSQIWLSNWHFHSHFQPPVSLPAEHVPFSFLK